MLLIESNFLLKFNLLTEDIKTFIATLCCYNNWCYLLNIIYQVISFDQGCTALILDHFLLQGSYIFLKGVEIWHPGKVMQVTSPYNIICYSFLDTSITITSRSKLSSFLNYGCKVDFDLLESDEAYQKGIIECIASFAEVHRPDLLKLPDRDLMLLDWARLGFVGCHLLQSDIPQILVDYKTDQQPPTFCEDNERPSSSSDWNDCTPPKVRKLSLQTQDSGYSSPITPTVLKSPLSSCSIEDLQTRDCCRLAEESEVGSFVLGKLVRYGWWPGLVSNNAHFLFFLTLFNFCSKLTKL